MRIHPLSRQKIADRQLKIPDRLGRGTQSRFGKKKFLDLRQRKTKSGLRNGIIMRNDLKSGKNSKKWGAGWRFFSKRG